MLDAAREEPRWFAREAGSRGDWPQALKHCREWIARAEAAVEFVDESETHLPSRELRRGIEEAAATCDDLLGGFGVVPEARLAHLRLEVGQLALLGGDVKESPGWQRSGFGGLAASV